MLSDIKASKSKKMGPGIEMNNSPPKKNLEILMSVLQTLFVSPWRKKKALILKKGLFPFFIYANYTLNK